MWTGQAVAAGLDLATIRLLRGDPGNAGAFLLRIASMAQANLDAAPGDNISARHYYRLAVLRQLVDGEGAAEAAARLAERPRQQQANPHLAALLARLVGDRETADELDEQLLQAGFISPQYQALSALAAP